MPAVKRAGDNTPLSLNPSPKMIEKRHNEIKEMLRRIQDRLGMTGMKVIGIPDNSEALSGCDAGMNLETLNIYYAQVWGLLSSRAELWATFGHETLHRFSHPRTSKIHMEEYKALMVKLKGHEEMAGMIHNLYSDTIINRAALYLPIAEDTETGGYIKGMRLLWQTQFWKYQANYARWLHYKKGWSKDQILKEYPEWKEIRNYVPLAFPVGAPPDQQIVIESEQVGIDNVLKNKPNPMEELRWTATPFECLGMIVHGLIQYMAIEEYRRNKEQMFEWLHIDPWVRAIKADFTDIEDLLTRLYMLCHYHKLAGHTDSITALVEYAGIMNDLFLRTTDARDYRGALYCPKCKWVDMDHNFKLADLKWAKVKDRDINDCFIVKYFWTCPKCSKNFEVHKMANMVNMRARKYYNTICTHCGYGTMVVKGVNPEPSDAIIYLELHCNNDQCQNDTSMVLNAYYGVDCVFCGGWSAPGYHRSAQIIKNMKLGDVPGAKGQNPHKGQDIPAKFGGFDAWLWTRCMKDQDEDGELNKKWHQVKKVIPTDPQEQMEDIQRRYWCA